MEDSLLMTELVVFSNQLSNCSNNNNNNKWYSSVYVCIKNNELSTSCHKFSSFQGADNFLNNSKYRDYTMIPVCKWIPNKFHHKYLNYKLSNKLLEK